MKLPQTPEHHIQLQILERLQAAPMVRFAELKPDSMESNLFLYHLRKLIKGGLVHKEAGGYGLTTAGKSYIVRSNHETLLPSAQPIMLSVVGIQDPKTDELILLKRKLQPYMGMVGLISGKIHEGESFAEAAVREYVEKTGRPPIPLEQKGVFEIRYFEKEKFTRHLLCIMSVGQLSRDEQRVSSEHYEIYWGKREELFGPDAFPNHKEIFAQLEKPGAFIDSYEVRD